MVPDSVRLNFSTARVGIVDPSRFSLQITRSVLFGYGFRDLFEYSSAPMALARLKMAPVDLVVCDPYPNVSENLNALAALRDPRYGDTAFAPIIVTTASVSLELMQAARQAKVDCVLAKPFSATALLERILWAAKRPGMRDVDQPPPVQAAIEMGVIEIW